MCQCGEQVRLDRHGWQEIRTPDSFPKETLEKGYQHQLDTTRIVVHYKSSRVVPCNDASEKMALFGPIRSKSSQATSQLWHL